MPYFCNIDQIEAFRQMDYPAINVYYTMQDGQDGQWIGYACDYMRELCKHKNFLITETNAQGTGWSSRDQWPPYDATKQSRGFLDARAAELEVPKAALLEVFELWLVGCKKRIKGLGEDIDY